MDRRLDQKSARLIENTNRIGVDFLFADLATGLTFLQVALTTTHSEGRTRNFDKALQAYRTVLRFLPRVVPSPNEQLTIQKMLQELKTGLEDAGYSCEI